MSRTLTGGGLALLVNAACVSPGRDTAGRGPAGGDCRAVEAYIDEDGDGFGAGASFDACAGADGVSEVAGDCDDGNAEVHPGSVESCNGVDDDCNGLIDGDDAGAQGLRLLYVDQDGDGYGSASRVPGCSGDPGLVDLGGDCDDTDENVHPQAVEVCDGVDNDCDGRVDGADDSLSDEGATVLWVDADGDGFGDPARQSYGCEVGAGLVLDATDCDDADQAVNPAAEEVCGDGVDNNCDSSPAPCPAYIGPIDRSGWAKSRLEAAGFWESGGDLDGDGVREAAVGTVGGVELLSGDMTTSSRTRIETAVAGGLVVAELSGDAFDDLVARGEDDSVYVWNGPLTGLLGAGDSDLAIGDLAVGGAASYRDVLSVGDATGDGSADLLVTDAGTDELLLFAGPLSASGPRAWIECQVARSSSQAVLAEVTGDGIADVVVGASSSYFGAAYEGVVAVFDGGGLSGAVDVRDASSAVISEYYTAFSNGVEHGDINGDGYEDLLLLGSQPLTYDVAWRVYYGPIAPGVKGESQDDATVEVSGGFWWESPWIPGDLNGDGAVELFLPVRGDTSNPAVDWGYLFHGPVSGVVTEATADASQAGSRAFVYSERIGAVGDITADGLDDALGPCLDGASAVLCLMEGGGW